jgi:GMP synthase-like glutamine amidotransferase
MSIAVVRHVPYEDLGWIAQAVDRAGLHVRYFDAFSDAGVPDPAGHEAVILMGGPMSANDDLPWIEPELDMIRRAASAGRPVLGICLGSQLIARAMGAAVRRNTRQEIGWFPLHWTPAAADDPLFHDLPNPLTTFHWHGDTFDIPAGAEWLASSELTRNQAFRYGSNIYALQFHAEVTAPMIADWCERSRLPATPDPNLHTAEQEQLAATIFDRWTALVKASASTAAAGSQ